MADLHENLHDSNDNRYGSSFSVHGIAKEQFAKLKTRPFTFIVEKNT
jgi:hypothetical protein